MGMLSQAVNAPDRAGIRDPKPCKGDYKQAEQAKSWGEKQKKERHFSLETRKRG
jgi:hypothetical protein